MNPITLDNVTPENVAKMFVQHITDYIACGQRDYGPNPLTVQEGDYLNRADSFAGEFLSEVAKLIGQMKKESKLPYTLS